MRYKNSEEVCYLGAWDTCQAYAEWNESTSRDGKFYLYLMS